MTTTVEEALGAGPSTPAPAKAPVIILIAADKGGVGKTMITRALLDYLAKYGLPIRAFDTEPGAPVLKRFYPPAETLAADTVPGQMALVDAASNAAVTVVDCKAGLLSSIIKAFGRIHLLDDVKAGKLHLVLLHIIGPTVASSQEIETVMAGLKGADIIRVNNMTNPNATFAPRGDRQVVMTVPYLEEEAAEAVDQAGVGFAAFAGNPKNSRVLRGFVDAWLSDVHHELDNASLPSLIQRE